MQLVAGTTVGAGILALPATTEVRQHSVRTNSRSASDMVHRVQSSGFIASSGALTLSAGYMIVTGLLVAEVASNTCCALGVGSTSLTSMAQRTLGSAGAVATAGSYLFLHYAMLVACAYAPPATTVPRTG